MFSMKKGIILIVVGIVGSIAITACGPSEEEINKQKKLVHERAAQQAHLQEEARKSQRRAEDDINAIDTDSLDSLW